MRLTSRFLPYWLRTLWYDQIYRRFNPAQKWLTKKIPRTWRDKPELMEELLFECLGNFWIDEEGGEMLKHQFEGDYELNTPERKRHYRKVYKALKEAWDWAKIREQQWEKCWETLDWKQSSEREEELSALDTKHLLNIIKYRKSMWT